VILFLETRRTKEVKRERVWESGSAIIGVMESPNFYRIRVVEEEKREDILELLFISKEIDAELRFSTFRNLGLT
jgi:hypothetical protein